MDRLDLLSNLAGPLLIFLGILWFLWRLFLPPSPRKDTLEDYLKQHPD